MSDSAFLSAVKKITETGFDFYQLLETVAVLADGGDTDRAVQLYRIWISFNPSHPLLYVAHFNLGVLLTGAGDMAGARSSLEGALAVNPDFPPAYINLGNVMERLGRPEEAILQWSALATRLAPVTGRAVHYKVMALKQIGRVLEAHHKPAEAEAALQKCLDIDPGQREVVQHYVSLRLHQCKWPVISPSERVTRRALMSEMNPLAMAIYLDDPMLQLATAWNYSRTSVGLPTVNLQEERRVAEPARPRRLRIGYVSSDLREHAVGYLIAEVFELHDRQRFEVFAYYCGRPADDPLKERIKGAVEHWTDIGGLSNEAAARRIAADGIDILVDVNGYTREARTELFSLRPAPVIVNWLGYPGTMGSPYHHYIIADEWIIPPEHEIYYSEKVLRLPCYQPNDRRRASAPLALSRADLRLPEDAFVYCCFNGAQKISRFTFERWMAILKRVPGSVLWLLTSTEETDALLKERAEQYGISASRLIFAEKLANARHLARYPFADLFLDTAPYGAHTTASDSLWMGVPILTLSGRGFASRVCGSLTRAAGLPELVCSTVDEYVERAVAFGLDRSRLQPYREQLAANRDRCVLFDMDGLVRNLESLYDAMHADLRNGRLPRPDLTNLDVYQDVGVEEDHDSVDVMTVSDYDAWFRAKLARRHRLWPIGPDRRLWTEADIAREDREAERATAQDAAF